RSLHRLIAFAISSRPLLRARRDGVTCDRTACSRYAPRVIILFAACLLLAQVNTSSAAHRRGPGVALAWELAGKLSSGLVTRQEVGGSYEEVGPDDGGELIEAWRIAAPPIDDSRRVIEAIKQVAAARPREERAQAELKPIDDNPNPYDIERAHERIIAAEQ